MTKGITMTDPLLYHLLIVLGGILCVRWGFLLFSTTPHSDTHGESNKSDDAHDKDRKSRGAPDNGHKSAHADDQNRKSADMREAILSHLAPGTFLTVVGAVILICCLTVNWRNY
jgi:ABC-type nickel/cobalt efflux system permease component RcnA